MDPVHVSTELLLYIAIFHRHVILVTVLPRYQGPDQHSQNVFFFMSVHVTENKFCSQGNVGNHGFHGFPAAEFTTLFNQWISTVNSQRSWWERAREFPNWLRHKISFLKVFWETSSGGYTCRKAAQDAYLFMDFLAYLEFIHESSLHLGWWYSYSHGANTKLSLS